MRAVEPNSTPFWLEMKTWPLDVMRPKIWLQAAAHVLEQADAGAAVGCWRSQMGVAAHRHRPFVDRALRRLVDPLIRADQRVDGRVPCVTVTLGIWFGAGVWP